MKRELTALEQLATLNQYGSRDCIHWLFQTPLQGRPPWEPQERTWGAARWNLSVQKLINLHG